MRASRWQCCEETRVRVLHKYADFFDVVGTGGLFLVLEVFMLCFV